MADRGKKRSKVDLPPPTAAAAPQVQADAVADFLNGLLSNNGISDTDLIDLGGNAFNEEKEANFVVVRPCYNSLFDFFEGALAVASNVSVHLKRYVVLTGTAGIGKSYFGLYAARRWFLSGRIVRLWRGGSCWFFAPELDPRDVILRKHMSELRLRDGTSFWYLEGKDLENDLKQRNQRNLAAVYTIRDSGQESLDHIVDSGGPVLYTVSSGHTAVLRALKQKTSVASFRFLRYAPLWELTEFWARAIVDRAVANIAAHDIPYNDGQFRYETLVKEGYRRFGGSAREVLRFVDFAANELREAVFNSETDAVEQARLVPDNETLVEAIEIVTEKQANNAKSVAKSRAIVFQKIPKDNWQEADAAIATTYIRKLLLSASKVGRFTDVAKLTAALQGSGHRQSPYGVLYESNAHEKLLAGTTLELNFLGQHQASVAGSNYTVKQNVRLELPQMTAKVVLGRSLRNLVLAPTDSVESVYLLPFCTNFPSHDSFAFVKASKFYDAAAHLSDSARTQTTAFLEGTYVLVAFQMTVSGSGDYEDKPSHTLRGTHFKDHVDGLMGKVSPLLLDVVTIFVSPTETVRQMGFMPVLRASGPQRLKSRIEGFTQGVAPQYSVVVEDDYLSALIDEEETSGRPVLAPFPQVGLRNDSYYRLREKATNSDPTSRTLASILGASSSAF